MALLLNQRRDESYALIPAHKNYNFSGSNFTLEARIRPIRGAVSGGNILQKKQIHTADEFDFRLEINGKAGIAFSVADANSKISGEVDYHHLKREGIDLYDENWHQVTAIHQFGNLILIIDGKRFDIRRAVDPISFKFETEGPLLIGNNYYDNGIQYIGFIEEVRVWDAALHTENVLEMAGKRLIGTETDLLGYWPLDEDTVKDHSPLKNDGEAINAELRESPALPHFNGPYLLATADLLRDYTQTDQSQTPATVSTFHATISCCNHDGSPWQGPLTIWATEEVKIEVAGKEYSISKTKPYEALSDSHGQFTLSIPADKDLHAPVLKVHTPFMDLLERQYIHLDEALHTRMKTIKGEDLRKSRDQEEALMKDHTAEEANHIAAAVQKMMKHVVQPASDQSNALSGLRRAQPAKDVSRSPHWHHDPAILIPGFEAGREHARIEHLTHGNEFERPLGRLLPERYEDTDSAADQVTEEYWHLSFAHSDSLSGPATMASPTYETLTPGGYKELIKNLSEEDGDAPDVIVWNIWDWFVNGVKKVTNLVIKVTRKIVKDAVTGLKRIVETVSTAIKIAGEKLAQIVVKFVKKAVEFVKGVFKQIGVAIGKVISFFRSFFDWGDVVRTKEVLKHLVDANFKKFGTYVKEMEKISDSFFDDLKAKTERELDTVIGHVKGKHLSSATQQGSRGHRKGGAQQNWLMNKVKGNLGNATFRNPEPLDALVTDLKPLIKKLVNNILDKRILHGFENAWNDLQSAVKHPEQALQLLLAALLELVKSAAIAVLGIAKSVVDIFLEIIQLVVGAAHRVLTQAIHIPVVSWIYKTFISGGSELSVIDLLCLITAVPVTLTYKLLHSNKAPFSAEDVRGIKGSEFTKLLRRSRNGKSTEATWFKQLEYVCFVSFEFMNGADMLTSLLGDVQEIANMNLDNEGAGYLTASSKKAYKAAFKNFKLPEMGGCQGLTVSLLMSAPGLLANAFSAPFKLTEGSFRGPHTMEAVHWGFQFIHTLGVGAIVEAGASVFSTIGSSKFPTSWVKFGGKVKDYASPVFTTLTSTINIALTSAVFAEEYYKQGATEKDKLLAVLKGLMNLAGTGPGLFKMLGTPYLVEATDGIAGGVLIGIDAGCHVAGGGLAFAIHEVENTSTQVQTPLNLQFPNA